jgi:UTP--glucose-1-phosphate uridylyltransferase
MSHITKCLFPVAGYGTRFLPITKSVPKEMLPVLTKPLIQYGVEEAMSAGIKSMLMVTNKDKKAIKDYFLPQPRIESYLKNKQHDSLLDDVNNIIDICKFDYTLQEQMLGLGHAIYSGRGLVGNDPFAVILPDDLCVNEGDSVLSQMTKVYKKNSSCCIVAIEEVPSTEVSKYGVIDGEYLADSNNTLRVNSMVEKPSVGDAPSNLAIIGRYILTSEIFDILKVTEPDRNGEIQITDALMSLAKKDKVIAYKFEGTRFDCGSLEGYLDANNFFAKNH